MKKKTTKRKAALPSNWKTITLYNCQTETASVELTKGRDGKPLSPIYHKGINDWIASVTVIEGEMMGLEEVEVGETLGFAINHKLLI